MRRLRTGTIDEGFTLIELMIVVAIIGILAAVAIPAFLKYIKKSKNSEAKIEVQRLYNAAKIYFEEHGEFATSGAQTPGTFACTAGGQPTKHVPNNALWTAQPWADLAFQMNDRHIYSYIYVGTATQMSAIAIGDLDCDNIPGSFSLMATNTAGEFVGRGMGETNANE